VVYLWLIYLNQLNGVKIKKEAEVIWRRPYRMGAVFLYFAIGNLPLRLLLIQCVSTPNRTLIRLSVFAQRSRVSYKQTDWHTTMLQHHWSQYTGLCMLCVWRGIQMVCTYFFATGYIHSGKIKIYIYISYRIGTVGAGWCLYAHIYAHNIINDTITCTQNFPLHLKPSFGREKYE